MAWCPPITCLRHSSPPPPQHCSSRSFAQLLGYLHSSLHFSEKGPQRMCRKRSPWRLLECAGADTWPLAALSYQSPPSKCLAIVLLPPLHAGRLHRTPDCPRLHSGPYAVTDSCLQKNVYRLPEPEEKGFKAGGC